MAGPIRVEVFTSGRVDALIGVRTKVVALCLQEVCGQALTGIAVKIRKRTCHCRRGHARSNDSRHDLAPCGHERCKRLVKVRVEHEILELGIALVGILDLAEEDAPYDASATPRISAVISMR